MFSSSRGYIFGLTLFSLAACHSPFQTEVLPPLGRLPMPTKDEVALVNGRPLSITDFIAIRERLKTSSSELALWVGVATLALHEDARSRGKEVPLYHTYDIARYAIGEILASEAQRSLNSYFPGSQMPSPEEVKNQIDAVTQKAVVLRNTQALSMIQ